ncbi:hypothetical protein Tco_0958734 [Tanacetum coccineum]
MAVGKDKGKLWEKMMNGWIVYLDEDEQVPTSNDKDLEGEIEEFGEEECGQVGGLSPGNGDSDAKNLCVKAVFMDFMSGSRIPNKAALEPCVKPVEESSEQFRQPNIDHHAEIIRISALRECSVYLFGAIPKVKMILLVKDIEKMVQAYVGKACIEKLIYERQKNLELKFFMGDYEMRVLKVE